MSFRNCVHMYPVNRCVAGDPNCPHVDRRDLATQLFAPGGSNSELAAKLYRTNKPAYDAARAEAVQRGWMPALPKVPRCLQD
jgi:hypothetical protein